MMKSLEETGEEGTRRAWIHCIVGDAGAAGAAEQQARKVCRTESMACGHKKTWRLISPCRAHVQAERPFLYPLYTVVVLHP
jgi:hypothetical protein